MDEKTFSTKESTTSEDVIDFYDSYAEDWDARFENRKSTQKFHQMRLESFFELARLKKDETCIELGAGTGPYLEKIAPLVKGIICIGTDNFKIHEAFTDLFQNITDVSSMKEAVKTAYGMAQKGDVVLLSPACASFDRFENYEDRGRQFKQCVRDL